MRWLRRGLFVIAAAATALAACDPVQTPVATEPSKAPTLAQAAENAPSVLYFIKSNCGSNSSAVPLVEKLYAANKGAKKFYVVMNLDEAGAKQWKKRWNASFPIIPDPEKQIIGKYKVRASQSAILVNKDLEATKRFAGYGRTELEGINASLAVNGATAKVDLSDAPGVGYG